ncbi:MAG: chloride channel protein [Methylovirgula sp.]|uniref:chloride channel protein n=1 Tax=Methylovirgula sp. TaxID=1978224 RepID=UPI0030761596
MTLAASAPTDRSGEKPDPVGIIARWRGLVRRSEPALIILAIATGLVAAVLVALTSDAVQLLHQICFGVPADVRLSGESHLHAPYLVIVPAIGGAILGLTGIFIKRWRPRRPVDPIEANALHGGRMSLIDSSLIALQTVVSCGFGASVGLEAGYTQIGSGFGSLFGTTFRMRRSDMRTLVGCGAAGAIAAAFQAPLTGAFYGFELIIGTYTSFGLVPVIAASISAVLASRALGIDANFVGHFVPARHVTPFDLVAFLSLAVACAAVGIGVMRGVTFVESLFKRSRVPAAAQPIAGGLLVGVLALASPHVLASGHGALASLFQTNGPGLALLIAIVTLKSIASAISIGSGFRGGLFFASLYLGGLMGKIACALVLLLVPAVAPDASTYIIVGMAALAVAIIGAPLTMSFLALETTGDFSLALVVLTIAALVSVVVRRTFGYSFATWRLHLRGESIRSAQDVGWMRALTVRELMRTDLHVTPASQNLKDFKKQFALGSTNWVAGIDAAGHYAGLINVADAHLADVEVEAGPPRLPQLLREPETVLRPELNIKEAADLFDRTQSEALAVIDSDSKPIGLLTEAHVLRRYTEELERARRELVGEQWLGES